MSQVLKLKKEYVSLLKEIASFKENSETLRLKLLKNLEKIEIPEDCLVIKNNNIDYSALENVQKGVLISWAQNFKREKEKIIIYEREIKKISKFLGFFLICLRYYRYLKEIKKRKIQKEYFEAVEEEKLDLLLKNIIER